MPKKMAMPQTTIQTSGAVVALILASVAVLTVILPRVFAQGTIEMIAACKLDSTGAMRAVTSTSECTVFETAMEWQVAPESGTTFPLVCGGCNLQYMTRLQGRDLSEAWLFSASMNYGDFSEINFTGASLESAQLSFTDLENVNFTNANLFGVVGMDSATTTGVIWDNTICPDETNSDNNDNTCEGHF